jgi:cation:H+ antiporter
MSYYELLIDLLILLVAFVILDRGSLLAINGATGVSEATGLATSTVGFIILATSTSLPEVAVALIASIEGEPGISIGNVLGANIANICLIIGIPTIYLCAKGINCIQDLPKLEKHEIENLFFGLLISSIVPLYLVYREYASAFIGIILLAIFIIYNIQLSRTRITIKDLGGKPSREHKKFGKEFLKLILGVAIVVVCAYLIVNSSSNIAEAFGASKILIGGTIVAIGTTLPELAVSFKAMSKGQPGLAYGNAIGSCFFNITVILGLVFIFSEPIINMRLYTNMIIMSLTANVFFWYFLSMRRLGWKESIVLLTIYTVFIGSALGIQLIPI